MRSDAPSVYLAGPLGFSVPGRAYHDDVLCPAVRARGFEILDPWASGDEVFRALLESDDPSPADLAVANRTAGAGNADMLDRCDAVLAVLDGTDVDSGTAAEIGYAAAKGKPVIGLRTDFRLAGDNSGSIVNLQVEYFIDASRGSIETSLAAAVDALAAATSR